MFQSIQVLVAPGRKYYRMRPAYNTIPFFGPFYNWCSTPIGRTAGRCIFFYAECGLCHPRFNASTQKSCSTEISKLNREVDTVSPEFAPIYNPRIADIPAPTDEDTRSTVSRCSLFLIGLCVACQRKIYLFSKKTK